MMRWPCKLGVKPSRLAAPQRGRAEQSRPSRPPRTARGVQKEADMVGRRGVLTRWNERFGQWCTGRR